MIATSIYRGEFKSFVLNYLETDWWIKMEPVTTRIVVHLIIPVQKLSKDAICILSKHSTHTILYQTYQYIFVKNLGPRGCQ